MDNDHTAVMNGGCCGRRIYIVSRCARTLYNFRLAIVEAAANSGAEVVTMGAGGDGYDKRLVDRGIAFESIPVSLRGIDLPSDVRLMWHLFRRFRKFRPDVVHAFTIKPAIFGTIAAWAARVPRRIVTITGLGHAFTTAGFGVRSIVSVLYWFALRRAHLVFFQNPEDLELFVEGGLVTPGVARLVPGSGVDLKRFDLRPLPCRGRLVPRFLMIARLLREKGVEEFITAAGLVKAAWPEARFVLLGGIDARNPSALSEEAVQRVRASPVVEWIDEVVDVAPFIAESDVVVLPSYREGLPRSLLEGAAMGRALVATDVPGCRDVVVNGVNGLLVPPQDANSLARAMMTLCEHPERIQSLGLAGRSLVESKYDQEYVIRSSLQAYSGEVR